MMLEETIYDSFLNVIRLLSSYPPNYQSSPSRGLSISSLQELIPKADFILLARDNLKYLKGRELETCQRIRDSY